MRNLAELADTDADRAQEKARALVQEGAVVTGPLTPEQDESVRHVFKVLHGYYGNLFLSRYATGVLIEEGPNKGEDEGMVNARRMWAFALRTFSGATIKAALTDARSSHAEYPPNLPQFEALCKARMPRRVLRDKDAVAQIEMGQPLRSFYARRAREVNERHSARRAEDFAPVLEAGPGLSPLKQAIASAVATAGGDEAAELLRLDRVLPQRVSHE